MFNVAKLDFHLFAHFLYKHKASATELSAHSLLHSRLFHIVCCLKAAGFIFCSLSLGGLAPFPLNGSVKYKYILRILLLQSALRFPTDPHFCNIIKLFVFFFIVPTPLGTLIANPLVSFVLFLPF